jgi:hypothetical protein
MLGGCRRPGIARLAAFAEDRRRACLHLDNLDQAHLPEFAREGSVCITLIGLSADKNGGLTGI